MWSETEQSTLNKVSAALLKQQEKQICEMAKTIEEVMARVDQNDQKTQERLQSPEYLSHLQKVIRHWSSIDSENKRRCIRNLLSNAAGTNICGDDVIQTFIDWIEKYSDAHFKVISEVYQSPGSTRSDIWHKIHGTQARDDSAEADYFKNLISDLSMGRVIRQVRETDQIGRFRKANTVGRRQVNSSPYMISPFDDKKPYILTELGKQFVHYTMNEIVPKVTHKAQDDIAPSSMGNESKIQ